MSQLGRPLVRSVRDLGVQFLDNDVNITGHDCASSVILPGGRSFWIFGDTIEGPFETVRYLPLADVLSNTGCIVPLQDISHGVRDFEYLKSPDGQRTLGRGYPFKAEGGATPQDLGVIECVVPKAGPGGPPAVGPGGPPPPPPPPEPDVHKVPVVSIVT